MQLLKLNLIQAEVILRFPQVYCQAEVCVTFDLICD